MPKISIIIPVFNTEKYLKKCLESVLNQTLSDIEIICINDFSTDNSPLILKEFAANDSRIKIIDFKENKGVSKARNEGINCAKGEYIGFIDSDDFIDSDFYEKLYIKAKKACADAAKGNIYNFNPESGNEYLSDFYNMNEKIQDDYAYFYYGFTSAIYKTEFIKNNNIKFPDGINYFEDPFFSINCIINYNKVALENSAVYYYTENPDSSSKKNASLKSYSDTAKIVRILLSSLNVSKLPKNRYMIIFEFLFNFLLGHLSQNFATEIQSKAAKDALKLLNMMKCKDSSQIFFNRLIKKADKNILPSILRNKIKHIEKKPLISAIIPVYNAEKYLKRCLNSVICQTLEDIEIICINDCSKDNSLEILKQYASGDTRIKIIDCEENGGESKARNLGLEAANGEYITFVDNDDTIDLDFYEKLYNKAKETNADIIKGNTVTISYDGTKSNSHLNQRIKETGNKWFFHYEWWSAIYKSKIIKENNIKLPEGYILGGDILFLTEALYYTNKIEIIDNTSYYWIRREDSGESAILSKEKILSALSIYDKIQTNINKWYKNGTIDDISYNSITENCFWIPLEYIFRNEQAECKEICAEYLIKYYQNCIKKDNAKNYLKIKAPYLYLSVTNNDKNDLYNRILNIKNKKDFNKKNIFAKLREGRTAVANA